MEKGVPVRAISRSIAVLQCVNRGGSLSLTEIARLAHLPYPTASRIVQTLMHEGLVGCEPTRKRYHPTCKVESLASGYREDGRLIAAASAHLVDLTHRLGWPVTLSTVVGTSVVVRACTHDISALAFSHYYRGDTFPLLDCAPGHVHLAFVGDTERAQLLSALEPLNPRSVALEMFKAGRLTRRIREDGYAACDRTVHTKDPGKTSTISVPLLTDDGRLSQLSLNFFATAMSVTEAVERYLPELRALAEAISRNQSTPPEAVDDRPAPMVAQLLRRAGKAALAKEANLVA